MTQCVQPQASTYFSTRPRQYLNSIHNKLHCSIKCLVFGALILASCTGTKNGETQAGPTTHLTAANHADSDLAVDIPQQALINNYLNISVQAEPGTECRLTFIPPSGEILEMDTISEEDGLCKWRWRLEESVGRGHGRLIFTVNGVSDTHFIDIRPGF